MASLTNYDRKQFLIFTKLHGKNEAFLVVQILALFL